MRFDSRYAVYKMVESMAEAAGLMPVMPAVECDGGSERNILGKSESDRQE